LLSAPRRSQIIEWYAAEIGATLLLKPARDRASAAYLKVHPFGKLPAGQCDDGTGIFESGALLLYLADKYGGASTPENRVDGSKWVIWANASYWPAVEGTRKAPPALCAGLEAILSKTPFLLGNDFSVADAAVGAYLYVS
jgi:glutathione S-transferase